MRLWTLTAGALFCAAAHLDWPWFTAWAVTWLVENVWESLDDDDDHYIVIKSGGHS